MPSYLIDTKRDRVLATSGGPSEELQTMCAKLNAREPGRFEVAETVKQEISGFELKTGNLEKS